MFWTICCISILAFCILCAGMMIPQILLISFRRKLFDTPDPRKIHTSIVPRLGGMAFLPVIGLSLALATGVTMYMHYYDIYNAFIENIITFMFGLSALVIIYVVGLADDLIGIRYKAKFVTQIGCALLLIAGGLFIDNLHGMLWLDRIPAAVSWPFTILLTVFIINALNLIDGLDGLASSLSSVAMLTYGFAFFRTGQYLYALICAATLGVLIPFFYYNVFGNPDKKKKIFMGDTGSLTIGLILCILSFKVLSLATPSSDGDINLAVVAFSPLVVPCFDVIRVYMYRIRHKSNPFMPDKNHIHHRLLALGWNQLYAMLTIVTASLVFTAFNITLSMWVNVNLVILIDILLWTIGIYVLSGWIRRIRKRQELQQKS